MFSVSLKMRHMGAAAVEFAMMVPVFVILVMGSIEIGWALYIQNALIDASRLGARSATTDSSTTSLQIVDNVKDYMKGMVASTDHMNVVIDPDPALVTRGTPITVTVTIPYDEKIMLLPTAIIMEGITLESHTTMNKEY